jgi:hypothetical protein
MTVPNKSLVINTLSEEYGCSLKPFRGKQIIFEGIIGKERLIICTPSSKLHVRGHGWFDIMSRKWTQLIGIFSLTLPRYRLVSSV